MMEHHFEIMPGYNASVEDFRETEYPMLKGRPYSLFHQGHMES